MSQNFQSLQQNPEAIDVLIQLESALFVVTEMCKTIDSDQLQELFSLIETLLQLPEVYVAIRLQTTELFNAIAHLLSKQEANKRLVPEILKYTLRGFVDQRLTLPSSAYLFHILCKENAALIAPFALEIAQ